MAYAIKLSTHVEHTERLRQSVVIAELLDSITEADLHVELAANRVRIDGGNECDRVSGVASGDEDRNGIPRWNGIPMVFPREWK